MSSPTPERKGQRTRQRILSAARRVFAEVGYQKATIRGIAAAADVDKSSVIQYFGSKSNLFREAVQWSIPVQELTVSNPAETSENYLRGLLSGWAAEPNGPMAVLLRNSMTSEDALELLREQVTDNAVSSVAATIDEPDARLRAALLSAVLMGIASQRYLLQLPDLAAASDDEIVALMAPLLTTLISP
ncbi:TetR family transcriptional regulator [Mycolicibacterium phlei]|uniref:TetR/AcrR family transcriptional regulator n=1 Tax=Mycobacteroides chelonae TaxID=1774 RepID=UPI00061899C5|nr:TetR family transcriptional regulator [Mycobacteroides chelonae]VEG20637.1 TetR family transcriptional regulator [Mycolicibacterium phlei]AKC40926.1 TetR family transcriptional regulator [Mycobacteroides chelonae]ANB00673.1 TetR family transcriptional regulator [Mycobacteroides chelonae CCUG 47445]OLT81632.1 TetR family transcriptional regulator [Mycobacteroides chelonae]ORV17673.1 TetR family transcriptional regulator [Mycobacteroides chelonae]